MSPGEAGDSISELALYNESHSSSMNQISRCTLVFDGNCSNLDGIHVYSVNIQMLTAKKHLAELTFQLQLHRLHVVLIQESG